MYPYAYILLYDMNFQLSIGMGATIFWHMEI